MWGTPLSCSFASCHYCLAAHLALAPPALFPRLRSFVYMHFRQVSLCPVSPLLRSPLFPPFYALYHPTHLLFSHLTLSHKLPPLSHLFKSLPTTLACLLAKGQSFVPFQLVNSSSLLQSLIFRIGPIGTHQGASPLLLNTGLLYIVCHLGTLWAHMQPDVGQHFQVIFCQVNFQPLLPKP